jgi:FixJ family two-component response regulator
MASAAATRIFENDRANMVCVLGQQCNARSNSDTVPIVFLITDDISERESLKTLVAREGWQFETFESAREFLAQPRPPAPSCIILVLSPGLNCLEEQKELVRERSEVPIIVLSRYPDVPTTVQAIKAGAFDFFVKPFSYEDLLLGVRSTLEHSRLALQREMEFSDLRNCYASLTPREQQVMALVVSGLLNKQVGGELGISECTIKAHRGRVMRKMNANSLPDLVRMASALGLGRDAIRAV